MTILQMQCLLAYLGYAPGPIDGLDGPKTQTAREAFLQAEQAQDIEPALLAAVAAGRFAAAAEPEPGGGFWADIQFFKRSEFACKCGRCGGFPAEPDPVMVYIADAARQHFGRPATVTSGVRCPAHNAAVGGVANSRHLSGKACDMCIQGVPWADLLAYMQRQPSVRYTYHIEGSNCVHFDVD